LLLLILLTFFPQVEVAPRFEARHAGQSPTPAEALPLLIPTPCRRGKGRKYPHLEACFFSRYREEKELL